MESREIFHRCRNWIDRPYSSLRYKDGKWAFVKSETHDLAQWDGKICPYCGQKLIKLLNKEKN